MNHICIKAIEKLGKTYLNISVPVLCEEKDYLELLYMFKRVEHPKKCELNLFILLFEEMFLEKNHFKQMVEKSAVNEFIKLIDMQSITQKIGEDKEYQVIEKCLKKIAQINPKEILLVYYIMNNKRSSELFFKCFQIISSNKYKNYLENKDIKIENVNYYTFVFHVMLFLDSTNKSINGLYTIDYKNNKLSIKEVNNEEIENYCRMKEISKREILEFTQKVKIVQKVKEIEDNKINKIIEVNQKQINSVNDKPKELNDINKSLAKEIEELKKTIKDLNDRHTKDIKLINERHDKDIENMEKKHNNNLKIINEMTDNKIKELNRVHNENIKKLRDEIKSIKIQNNSLITQKENIKKNNTKLEGELVSNKSISDQKISELNNKLNETEKDKEKYRVQNELMKKRDSSKYIIDFLYVLLENKVDLDIKYEIKLGAICKTLKKSSNENSDVFIENLCQFLDNIYKDKIKGDKITHGNEFMSDIFRDNGKMNDFFIDYLEVVKYFKNFKSLYLSKNKEEVKINTEIILKICEGINFFSIINEFILNNK